MYQTNCIICFFKFQNWVAIHRIIQQLSGGLLVIFMNQQLNPALLNPHNQNDFTSHWQSEWALLLLSSKCRRRSSSPTTKTKKTRMRSQPYSTLRNAEPKRTQIQIQTQTRNQNPRFSSSTMMIRSHRNPAPNPLPTSSRKPQCLTSKLWISQAPHRLSSQSSQVGWFGLFHWVGFN